MSVQTDPVPPVPEHTPPLKEDDGTGTLGKYFNHAWTRWFISLREKINVISESLVNLGDVTGTGIVVKNGDNWFARTLQAGFGIDITNPDGVTGDPVIIHEDTSNVANVAVDNSGGTVLQDVTFTFDSAGHVLTATFGSVNLDTRYLQDAPSNGSIYGRQNGAWVVVPGGGGTTVNSVVAGSGIDVDATDPANPVVSVDTNLSSGTYTPSVYAGTGTSSPSGRLCRWMRVGNTIYVAGRVDFTADVASGNCSVELDPPVASAFVTSQNMAGAGTVVQPGSLRGAASMAAVFASGRLGLFFTSQATGSSSIYFSIAYDLL